jgi:hypothetical protein
MHAHEAVRKIGAQRVKKKALGDDMQTQEREWDFDVRDVIREMREPEREPREDDAGAAVTYVDEGECERLQRET